MYLALFYRPAFRTRQVRRALWMSRQVQISPVKQPRYPPAQDPCKDPTSDIVLALSDNYAFIPVSLDTLKYPFTFEHA